MGQLHAFGDIKGNECESIGDDCDPYVKLFINDQLIHKTATVENTLTFDVNHDFISQLIPNTSVITIEIWDDDSGFLGSADDLVLRTNGDVSDFLKNPFRGGTITTNASPNGQNSINTFVFWQDEYENTE